MLSLLKDIRRAGVTRDMISFSAAISACEKGGQWQTTLSLLEDIRWAGVILKVFSLTAAMSACERVGNGSTRGRCWKTSAGRA